MNQTTNPPPSNSVNDDNSLLECDLIMKGGITSGIVYPKAIHHLSQHYRFRSIGGASAGAIAAALSAAAQYGRAANPAVFDQLRALPDELGAPTSNGMTRMLSLFDPDASTRPSFNWLLAFLDSAASTGSRAVNLIHRLTRLSLAAAWQFPLIALLAAVGFAFIAWPAVANLFVGPVNWWHVPGPVFGGVFVFVAIALLGASGLTIRALCKNNFGLVSGRDSLTQWLHDKIQAYAGLGDRPLTFGDLWAANECAPHQRKIDLRMMTTCLSHGRGYCFPVEGNVKLYFKESELAALYPADVVRWLKAKSRPSSDAKTDELMHAEGLCRLPLMRDLPIIVVVRMSLSFPILLSAVPLWEQSFRDGRKFRRIWFSDGGLISNFPIHLFDALIPSRPTFGITLVGTEKARDPLKTPDDHVFLPRKFGPVEAIPLSLEDNGRPSALAFISALFNTLHGWTDRAQQRVPGFQERVVSIALGPGEGGLNLRMMKSQIDDLAERGLAAARRLMLHYHPTHAADRASLEASANTRIFTTWPAHRWVRYRTAGLLLEEALEALLCADEVALGRTDDLRSAHDNSPSYDLGGRRHAARDTYLDLLELATRLRERRTKLPESARDEDRVPGDDGVYGGPDYPRPRSRLRVMPRD